MPTAGAIKNEIKRTGDEAIAGPIDVDYKSKMSPSGSFTAPSQHEIKTWGRVGTDNKVHQSLAVDGEGGVASNSYIEKFGKAVAIYVKAIDD